MPTYYVEDYDGKRNADAAEPLALAPVSDDGVQAKVVAAADDVKPAKKTTAARTKSGDK